MEPPEIFSDFTETRPWVKGMALVDGSPERIFCPEIDFPREISDIFNAIYAEKLPPFLSGELRFSRIHSIKQKTSVLRTVAVGPLRPIESIGVAGWECLAAFVFGVIAGNRGGALSVVASVHFFQKDVETERREWLAKYRANGAQVIRMPTEASVMQLDGASACELRQVGVLPPR